MRRDRLRGVYPLTVTRGDRRTTRRAILASSNVCKTGVTLSPPVVTTSAARVGTRSGRVLGAFAVLVAAVSCGRSSAQRRVARVPSVDSGGATSALPPRSRTSPPRAASGGALALAPVGDLAAVADADADEVVVLDLSADAVRVLRRIEVGAGPAQVVFDGTGRVFVTERRAGTVSIYDLRDGRRIASSPVARDPIGVALSPDEESVYVTSGLGQALTAFEARDLVMKFSIPVARSPRGLAVSRDGREVYIAHMVGVPLSVVDVGPTPPALRAVPPLPLRAPVFSFGDNMFPLSVPQSPALGASVAMDPQSGRVYVPFMVNRTGGSADTESGSYGGDFSSILRTKFSVAAFDPATGQWAAVEFPNYRPREFLNLQTPRTERDVRLPSAAVLAADGSALLVASEGTGHVVTVARPTKIEPPRGTGARVVATLRTIAAPCGIAESVRHGVLVYSQIDHAVEWGPAGGRLRLAIGDERLTAAVARGRRLFVTADDPRLSEQGLACAGCHPDGYDDGLVWNSPSGGVQTPSLAGRLVPPFGWSGRFGTLDEVVRVTIRRLRGTGLPPEDVAALSAFLEHGLPRARRGDPSSAESSRGRALFEGTAGCASCHDRDRAFADGQRHVLTQGAFDTPSLVDVAATPPYLHDGSALTLRGLLTDPRLRMGHSSGLDAEDIDALAAYLADL